MKKTLIILFLSLGFCINNAQAQTKEQTIEWLKSKAGNIHNPEFAKMYYLALYGSEVHFYYPNGSHPSTGIRHVKFSNVNSANYVYQDGVYKLRIMGKIDGVTNPIGGYFYIISDYFFDTTTLNENSYSVIEIWYSVTEDEIKRIKKAYEHLAKLCGGNVANDDLFKN